ncbi:MAG: hypothetical protein M3Z25_19105 [Actinomycetota bacterium]|nr:hypothetical protein [Actinomycetota bacterium]
MASPKRLRGWLTGGRPVRESIAGRNVGSRVKRLEDLRLLTGRGRYVDDVVVVLDMLHAAFLRSSQRRLRAH